MRNEQLWKKIFSSQQYQASGADHEVADTLSVLNL